MKLSTIFELLLIFLIISFAASKVIEFENEIKWKKTSLGKSAAKELRKERQSTLNKYCSCSNFTCNCCRDFSLPVVPVRGPGSLKLPLGCASLKYVQGDSMLVTMSFAERVLRNVTVSGKKSKPICMNLADGVSKFCGRLYEISGNGDQIKACLGLELRALNDVEAALRVSCFKLGPNGLNVGDPDKPVPADDAVKADDDVEGDDNVDDDVFGLADDDDSKNTVESAGGGGFSALGDQFLETFSHSVSTSKKNKLATASAAHNGQPQLFVSPLKPAPKRAAATIPIPATTTKPSRVITTKLVLSTPSKGTNVEKMAASTTQYDSENVSSFGPLSTVLHKYTLSPFQYKPTEKVRPLTVNQQQQQQPPERYRPTILQLSTKKVYPSPQHIFTDKVDYVSTIIDQYENAQIQQNNEHKNQEITAAENEPTSIANLYAPTTQRQRFASTERVFMAGNLSTVATLSKSTNDFDAITSTSFGIDIVQSSAAEQDTVNDTKEMGNEAAAITLNSEYNESDSDNKPAINDVRYEYSSAADTPPPNKINYVSNVYQVLSTSPPTVSTADRTGTNKQQNKIEDNSDGNEFEDVVDSVTNVFEEVKTDSSKGDETIFVNADPAEVLTDSEKGGIVLAGENQQSISYENGQDEKDDDETEEIDDDEFRIFGTHLKNGPDMTMGVTNSPVPQRMHSGREHKRMNLPSLFSQKPEISSFWSSGGHLYKIRTSATMQDQSPASFVPNINRLGRLNLFVPVTEMNSRLNEVLSNVSSISAPRNVFEFVHRFKLAENRNQTNKSRRNHKYLKD